MVKIKALTEEDTFRLEMAGGLTKTDSNNAKNILVYMQIEF